jgi:hypothetical protein
LPSGLDPDICTNCGFASEDVTRLGDLAGCGVVEESISALEARGAML